MVRPAPLGRQMDQPPQLVIIVEDDQSMSQALERLLRIAGYTARSFPSAEELLEADAAADAACLILDVQLPGMTGFELREQLARRGHTPPVIFITAYDEPESRLEADRASAVAYFTKPFAGRDLLEAVQRARRGSPSARLRENGS